MQARSALFDVYGDHLRHRGGVAPVAALVRLLAALDINAPAVRTAISRMVRQGWLEPVATADGPGYGLTARAERRLDDAYARIYRTDPPSWDGQWHVVVVGRPGGRTARERLASGLAFLGYAELGGDSWVAPRPHPELDAVLAAEGVAAQAFTARFDGSPAALAERAWDLDAVAAAYERFERHATALLADSPVGGADPDRAAFALRSQLVHEWRGFLFLDPGLPDAVLPDGWPGRRAAELFDSAAGDLLPAARQYVARCLAGSAASVARGGLA